MMATDPREHWLGAARIVVERLGLPAEEQLEYLRRLGVEGSIDELGLEFDDVWAPIQPLLGPGDAEARRCLEVLDHALSSDAITWSESALRDSPGWDLVRVLAREGSVVLGRV